MGNNSYNLWYGSVCQKQHAYLVIVSWISPASESDFWGRQSESADLPGRGTVSCARFQPPPTCWRARQRRALRLLTEGGLLLALTSLSACYLATLTVCVFWLSFSRLAIMCILIYEGVKTTCKSRIFETSYLILLKIVDIKEESNFRDCSMVWTMNFNKDKIKTIANTEHFSVHHIQKTAAENVSIRTIPNFIKIPSLDPDNSIPTNIGSYLL